MIIQWHPLALDDLEALRSYVASTNPTASRLVLRRIHRSVWSLSEFPLRGRVGRIEGTRELVVPRTPFIVAYQAFLERILILRILHGAQRWPVM